MKIDEDRPLDKAESDEYGFAPIAAKLSGSIAGLADSEGVVFGIEGPWGSGKTSFLNLLKASLAAEDKLHVLTISPWLLGDARSLVVALGDALAPIFDAADQVGDSKGWTLGRKKKVAKTADLIRGYAARTGRGLAPLAKLAGVFVPGVSMIGDAMEYGANALDGVSLRQSDEDLKAEIIRRIVDSKLRFVVLIDDLDRLEPAQVVEVMRLIRSVADFPRFAYVLCYDREVLAQALETGLSVEDGDLFMQKIVQLTFALPQPEPFDLRVALRRKCMALFTKINDREPSYEEGQDIAAAIDREGGGLRTPRDVKLVMNGLSFIYPAIAEDVYFPDLCRVHLLKALQPKLHTWLEMYLGVRSAVVAGDASVSKAERAKLGDQLFALLPDDDSDSTNSIWSLRRFVPGVRTAANPEDRVFQESSTREVADQIADRRVGSPLHHRFYFALSAPKAMILPARMVEIRQVAGTSLEGLQAILAQYVNQDRSLSQSWYEHLMARLDDAELRTYSVEQLSGLALGFATTHEAAQARLERRMALTITLTDKVELLVDAVIRRMRALDAASVPVLLERLYREGSLSWLVGHFHRRNTFQHVGERAKAPEHRTLTVDEMATLSDILRQRTHAAAESLLTLPDFGAFIWGWRDLEGADAVKEWIATYASDDKSFLLLLTHLRSWAVSDRVYYPLRKDAVEQFFVYDDVSARLDAIHTRGDKDEMATVEELRKSLRQGAQPD